MGVAAAYLFWRWLKRPTWGRTMAPGLMLGLAELTKMTWIVLFGLWPALWVVWRWTEPKGESGREEGKREKRGENAEGRGQIAERTWRRQGWQMGVILLLGLYVLNLGYGFEGSFQKLGHYGFVSETLGGPKHDAQRSHRPEVHNRFEGTWLAGVPVPLPKNYLMGIDLQRWDFERKMPSYLRGEWRLGGWWYYYLYALGVKVPLGTWVLVLLATGVSLLPGGRCPPAIDRSSRRGPDPWPLTPDPSGYSASWRDELVLLAPAVVVLTLVSSQTGFSHHLRYVLPIFPFVLIWTSKVARAVELKHWKIASLAGAALVWLVGSSLYCYPHSLSYFNELVGGPKGGHYHLLDSNIDWGQDLLYLNRWLEKHPEARLNGFAFFNCYGPGDVGMDNYPDPPPEPQPGWYAMSVNRIHDPSGQYEYFLRLEPVGMAGYSIYIYHVTLDEANRARRELGLPELPDDWQPPGEDDDA